MEVIPAYGRVYTKQADVMADWKNGKDFQDAFTRQYLSVNTPAEYLRPGVTIRYGKRLEKVVYVSVK